LIEHTGVFIKTMHGGQVLVAVTQVILAELSRDITMGLKELCDRWIFFAEA